MSHSRRKFNPYAYKKKMREIGKKRAQDRQYMDGLEKAVGSRSIADAVLKRDYVPPKPPELSEIPF